MQAWEDWFWSQSQGWNCDITVSKHHRPGRRWEIRSSGLGEFGYWGLKEKKRKRNKEADDQRRRHCSDSSADRMSRGRRSDFALCSDAGAVQSPDWEIRNRTVAEPNRYQVLSFWFYLLIYLFMKLIKRRRMVWVWLKKKKKQNGAFYGRFSDSQGYKFIFFSQNRLTLSRSRLSLELSPSPAAAPRLCSHRRLTQRLACDLTVAWRSAASPELSPSLTSHGKTTVSFFVFSVLFVFVCFPFHLFGKAESLND